MAKEKEDKKIAPEEPEAHESHAEPDEPRAEKEPSEPKADVASDRTFSLGSVWRWALTHKKISIPLGAAVVLAIVFAVPVTRYTVLGLFLKQDFPVVVLDAQTNRPVSAATVSLAGKTASTDGQGRATLHVPVSQAALLVSKQYYEASLQTVTVPVGKPSAATTVKLVATGRVVPITVHNKISGKAVAGASIVAGKSKAKTDQKGQAVLVVPAGVQVVEGSILSDGYNKVDVSFAAITQDPNANTFGLTPSGKVYFLSNQSGKIDVVKSDLDGLNRQTVLAGTGKESKGETVLLATRDWQYLALYSKRDGGDYSKLFLIKTADDSLTTMDEGDATFTLTGWEGHRFVYVVTRNKLNEWDPKKQALKSYDVEAKKITTLDQTAAEGSGQYDYMREIFGEVYVLGGRVVYSKGWQGGYNTWHSGIPNKQVVLSSAKPDASDKKTVKSFSAAAGTQASSLSLQTRPYGPDELYLQWQDAFFEYEDGKVKELPSMNSDTFYGTEYATYLASPSGKQVFWSQDRDGKLSFMLGDAGAENESSIATLETDYQTYGWYTDDYLLVSRKGSELYIMPAAGVQKQEALFKVTDYYRPIYSYRGYGGGYGGI